MSKFSDIIKSLRPRKTSNFRVIMLCLIAATTFWFFNALNENYSTTLKYPIHFIYDTESYVAKESLPDNVQINVSGLGWNLFRNSIGIKVTPLEIPLENPSETKKIVAASVPSLINDQLNEFQLNYVLTDTLFLDIDLRTKKTFRLAIDSANINLENEFGIVGQIQFSPKKVELHGPASIIDALSDTIFISIPQEAIDENYNEDLAINIPNGNLIRRNPPTVNVGFDVNKFENKEVLVEINLENMVEKAYIKTEEVKVSYKIESDSKTDINKENINVMVDFSKMNTEDSTIIPHLKSYPKKIRDVQIDTTRIKVYFNE